MTLDPRTPVLVGVGAVTQREADPARAREPLAVDGRGARARGRGRRQPRAARARRLDPRAARLLGLPRSVSAARGALRSVARADRDRRDRRAADDAARTRRRRHRGRARRRRAGRRRGSAAPRAACARGRGRGAAHAAGAHDAGLGAAAARVDPERARDARGAGAAGRPVRDARECPARGRGRLPRRASPRDRDACGRRSRGSRPGIPTPGLPRTRERRHDRRSRAESHGRLPVRQAPLLALERRSGRRARVLLGRDGARARPPARALDLSRSRSPTRTTWSPLSERRDLHRCAGFARAAERAFGTRGRRLADVAHRDLYSCFPAAVRVQQREIGIRDERPADA